MGGDIKKRKNKKNKLKKKSFEGPQSRNSLTPERSLNVVQAQQNEANTTRKGTQEANISDIMEPHVKKRKHSVNTSKLTLEKNESIEEQSKGKKKLADNSTSTKHQNDEELDIEEQPKKKEHPDVRQKTDEDDESDIEDKPKKKKKKKQPVADETTNKKGKKSNRQMKREKFLQRQAEAELASKSQLKSECLNYLSQWKHDKQNWKFMKAKQVWLFKNKFSNKFVPDESWPLLLEYFQTGQGNIRKMLNDDASKVIKQMDEWTESQENKTDENEDENATETTKPDDTTYKRARDLIQCLQ